MSRNDLCRYTISKRRESQIIFDIILGGILSGLFIFAVFDFEDAVFHSLGIGGAAVCLAIMLVMSNHRKIKVFDEKCICIFGFSRKEYEFSEFAQPESLEEIVAEDVLEIRNLYIFYNKEKRELFRINDHMENATRFYDEMMSYFEKYV